MEAIKEIVHVKGNMVQISVPPSYNDQDVEVIVLPSAKQQGKSFSPNKYYGFIDVPSSQILPESKKLRDEWERDA